MEERKGRKEKYGGFIHSLKTRSLISEFPTRREAPEEQPMSLRSLLWVCGPLQGSTF